MLAAQGDNLVTADSGENNFSSRSSIFILLPYEML